MSWLNLKNLMNESETDNAKFIHPKGVEITMQKVFMDPEDIEHLIELQGDEDYDDEGHLTFEKLKDLFKPEFVNSVTKKFGKKIPLDDYEEENHWKTLLNQFRTKGKNGDTEAVILPSNIIELFDKITGMKNINPETGHKQYASMSGFLRSLGSYLPAFGQRNAQSVNQNMPINFTAPNAGPNMASMYGLPGQNMFSSLYNNVANAFGRAGNAAYNAMPANPFARRPMQQMPVAPQGTPAAARGAPLPPPPNTWEHSIGNAFEAAGNTIGHYGGGWLGNLVGAGLGSTAGTMFGQFGPHPIPRSLARSLFGGIGALVGAPIAGWGGREIGSRTGAYVGQRTGRAVGRGLDAAQGAAQFAYQHPVEAAGRTMDAMPGAAVVNRMGQIPNFAERLMTARPGGMQYGMPGYMEEEDLRPTTPLLDRGRARSDSSESFRSLSPYGEDDVYVPPMMMNGWRIDEPD